MNPPVHTASESAERLRRRSRLVLLSSLLISTSCGDGEAAGSQGSLGIWRLSDEPSVVIGGADEREGYLLHQVVGATRLSDGRIVVANGSSLQLRYYDPEGGHLFDAGGEGDGPGEFRMFQQLTRIPGDSVLVLSWRSGITRFGPDGRYASSSPYELPPLGDCRRLTEGGQRLLPDGSILLQSSVFVGLNADHEECPQPSQARPPVTVGRFDPTTGLLHTIAELPGVERVYDIESQYAYAKSLVDGIARDRVYLGDTGSDVILAMSYGGDTLAILPVPFEPVAVPADARAKQFEDQEWTGGGQTFTERTTFIYSDDYPRYARLVAAPEDRVWVMAYPPLKEPGFPWELESPTAFRRLNDGGARWKILDREGVAIAELQTPPGFFLLEVGDDYIFGLHKDEFERESVRLYGLMR